MAAAVTAAAVSLADLSETYLWVVDKSTPLGVGRKVTSGRILQALYNSLPVSFATL